MEEFLASSPPAWNAEIPQHKPPAAEDHGEVDIDEELDLEIEDIPNAHFEVLKSSVPLQSSTREYGEISKLIEATDPNDGRDQHAAERAARALLSPAPQPPAPPFENAKPLQKSRWHFGIRSRSPPMEVMLEIYKTLQLLGMEWRKKDGISLPEIGPVPPGGYTEEVEETLGKHREDHPEKEPVQMGKKPPAKKEAAAIDKAAQGLFFVETRARYGDVMVRMDLQLYRVDDQNYLVDFRNMGYFPVHDSLNGSGSTLEPGSVLSDGSGAPLGTSVGGTALTKGKDQIGGVSGPFHFLEMACQLIAELASG